MLLRGEPSFSIPKTHIYHSVVDSDDSSDSLDLGSLSLGEVKSEYEKMFSQNRTLKRTIKDMRKSRTSQDPEGKSQDILTELQHAKEALSGTKVIC